jgi:uncharacterized protein (DUF302 family)
LQIRLRLLFFVSSSACNPSTCHFSPFIASNELGACNPPLAHRALSADLDVGLLLPCNVVVYETGTGESMVGLVNPVAMASIFTEPVFNEIAADVQQRFTRIAAALSA